MRGAADRRAGGVPEEGWARGRLPPRCQRPAAGGLACAMRGLPGSPPGRYAGLLACCSAGCRTPRGRARPPDEGRVRDGAGELALARGAGSEGDLLDGRRGKAALSARARPPRGSPQGQTPCGRRGRAAAGARRPPGGVATGCGKLRGGRSASYSAARYDAVPSAESRRHARFFGAEFSMERVSRRAGISARRHTSSGPIRRT
jgi:hypothetical protein